jgi:hypothetical protein
VVNVRCDDWYSPTDNVEKSVRLDEALAPCLSGPRPVALDWGSLTLQCVR